ncbi:MAG: hypothetical protein OXE17_01485 [Chloroflexi bacterium]|nr:hypothetical protein [Chloroflexota bacterium]
MQHEAQPALGTEPPAGRLSRLSAASRRINESLNVDVDAEPQAAMDGARSLARAPYAAIVTLDAGALGPAAPAGVDPGQGCQPAGAAQSWARTARTPGTSLLSLGWDAECRRGS